ncbi:substrate-binding domain-containing protein [Qipengyuania sp. 6B39]|uniref:substrate-binding domain-containing protein n=1 Tax=Qipengyuania proteolytica TaxID=2867239 RepID=UPI001C8A9334|nr:substrate-binding domain-containing protein [Qipengyuania proteolytica]MBX7495650.1 substrate-binding domain-containing protein [Qipengyuania proteolytica]
MTGLKTILLLSDNPGEDYLARVRSGVDRACRPAGVGLDAINVYDRDITTTQVLEKSDHAGVILTPPVSDDRQILSLLEARGVPFVRIAALLDMDRGSTVGMDEYEAASSIVGHMTARGHRRIGIVRGPSSQLVSMRRYNGYSNALGAKGLRVDSALVVQGDFTRQSGREQAPKLFAAKPTAIFACNDEMAAGVIDAADAVGIAIPGDISLVGYDDNAVATKVRPQLTTVRQPCEAMGEAAGKLLVEQIGRAGMPKQNVLVPFEIVERDSVADYTG